ncbi:MAG: DUF58 domain-containing protein [Synergistaceae bacterium]|jgi:uncharacterized protein (DUF58 family)|nr:DUF58 domain-containing protein [Synergistaceae bacterium]
MKPTPRALLLFALSVPLALLIVSVREGLWYLSFYLPFATVAFMGADAMMALPGRRLRADLRAPKRLYVGQSGVVRLDLRAEPNVRPLPTRISIQALLEQTGEAQAPAIVSGTMTGGQLQLRLPVVPRRRGRVTLDALWLRWRGPLNLIERWRRQPVDEAIDIVPDVKGIHEAALQFFSRDTVGGVKTQRMKGEGTEFDSLQDYAPGMDNRMIDWKRSARHRKLLSREFRQERNHQIVLGFDTGHLMIEPIDGVPKLDHAIRAGLLLGWISLHSGDFVGGCGFDARFRSFIKPGHGMSWFTQIQRFTADLAYRTEETNFTLGLAELNSRLRRRALVVLFTEFVDLISAELLIEGLQRMAGRHVVVFVTLRDPMLTRLQSAFPDSFMKVASAVVADDFLRERSIVLKRITRLGVHCLDVPAPAIAAALLNRYLTIKQRGLL